MVPALRTLATTSDNLLARFHAMWTLEGLGALDASLVRNAMKDPNPRMRIQAIRASESLFKAGDRSFEADYRAATKDADVDVALQAMLTINVLKFPDAAAVIQATMDANTARGIREIGKIALEVLRERAWWSRRRIPTSRRSTSAARRSIASSASRATAMTGEERRWRGRRRARMMGPPIAGSPRVQGHRDYVIRTIYARPHGSARRQDLHERHGGDGRADERLGRRDRVLCPQRFREQRVVCHGGRRRARPRGDGQSQNAVDGGGNRQDAAGARAVGSDVDARRPATTRPPPTAR